jgi:Kyakuja-Dileera-Zisupton transposase
VSIACARHGCYAPQALVDLFKGEQQKNVDFAFLRALSSTSVAPEQGVLLIYDIACQYSVYLQDRIGNQLPAGLDIDVAIGLFHVHAHKDQCFFQYATSFIPGAGIVAGEILESLWSSLNSISPTARTATLAHRAEMLDDHATDSNHKKTLGIISSLCRSHRTAVDMLDHAQTYYNNLTDEAGNIAVEKWTQDINEAEAERKNDIMAMDIYFAKTQDSATGNRSSDSGIRHAEPGTRPILATWMELALAVEEKQ